MLDKLEKAYDIYMNDNSKIKKSLIGVLALLFSWLIIPYLIYQGYLIRILKQTQNGDFNELPQWNNPTELLVLGLTSILLSITLNIPLIAVSIIPFFVENGIVSITVNLIVSLASFVMSYVVLCVLSIVFRDDISEISNVGRILNIIKSGEYIINYIIITAIGVIFGIVCVILLITIIGIPLIIVLMPILSYLTITTMGLAITEAEADE